MSNQYPGQPGQPGDLPPTQVAPGNVPQQPGPPGYPQQPQAPYGAPGGAPGGGGYPPPPGAPGGYGAPPPPSGGGKKTGLILAIVGVVVLLLIGAAVAAFLLLGGDDDDEGDDAADPVTSSVTAETPTSPTDVTTAPSTVTSSPTEVTTSATSVAAPPLDDAEITARAYLDSLVTGDCLAVEGLSTPEWFASEYKSQQGCKRQSPNADMSQAQYDFERPIENADGTVSVVATVTAPDVSFTGTWSLVPSPDGSVWLVDFFLLI